MLQLKNIKKTYEAGENSVHALRGISLSFRKSEFVSILGPSGCGKTTMLNIIGGLDQYTDGDLVIDGVSTKAYKDRDWDAYRNHSIGFVFQSYNLIPHQTVLKNVELALTLSGVKAHERKARAKKALEAVGLGDQLKKKPGEMSGGQMQRVAIARALVNDPDIILADEPTGALDTETSVQVMELLKEISKEKLVIMVTHNPELAEKYSTRIIRMLDGVITGDSQPYTEEMPAIQPRSRAKAKKPSMSFFTSFGLSLTNLFTKKGRTVLTSFAGSIGIIGIALIFAVSQGMTTYINVLQEDTLSSYPLTIEATTVDLGTLMQTFMGAAAEIEEHEKDAIYSQSVLFEMINALNNMETTENDLESFKAFIDGELTDPEGELTGALSGVQYTYDPELLVYTKNVDGTIVRSDTQELLSKALYENFGMDITSMMNFGEDSGMMSSSMMSLSPAMNATILWTEMLSAKDGGLINPVLKNQYDVVYGDWPTEYNEIVLVLDENNELDDLTLYALGLKTEDEINAIFDAVKNKGEIDTEQQKWSYQQIHDMDFRVILGADCYTLDENSGLYTDLRETDAGLRYLYDNALTLKVSGIIRPSEEATSAMLGGSIGYTKALTEYIIEHAEDSPAVQAQLADTRTDILTGLPFNENTGKLDDAAKETALRTHLEGLDAKGKAQAFVDIMSVPSQEQLDAAVEQSLSAMDRAQREEALKTALTQQMGMSEGEISEYIEKMSDEDLEELMREMVEAQVRMQMAAQVQAQLANVPETMLAAQLDAALPEYTTEQCALYYDEILEFSESSLEDNLIKLGHVDLSSPASVNLYASSFENKDVIEEVIARYNAGREELQQVHYTDYVGIMMSSITTIIDAITYILIAFVAISLIVSSIMIGVITLISVQERTKEIGILRAIGASKRNVSSMFNAETLIIGFASGLVGVGLTYLLCIPINAIIQSLTGIPNLSAILPVEVAVVLILISMALTLLAGIIPSRSAARKDPVVALRTE